MTVEILNVEPPSNPSIDFDAVVVLNEMEDSRQSVPVTMMPVSEQARIVEAVLFAAPEPMTVAQLRAAVPGDADMGAVLAELSALYATRGVTLREIDGRYAFRTADCVAPHLYQFRREEKKLSRAALETLAIIAYHQPITRTEIENIRGVATAKGTLDLIMEMGWIKPGKRLEIPGRPLTWLTTPAFLDHFGLQSLSELPGLEDLKASGLLDTRPAIDTLPDLFGEEVAQLNADAGVDSMDGDDEIEEDLELLPSGEDQILASAVVDVANQNEQSDFESEVDDDSEDESEFDDDDEEIDDDFDDDDDDDDFEEEDED